MHVYETAAPTESYFASDTVLRPRLLEPVLHAVGDLASRRDLELAVGFHDSPFGPVLLGASEVGTSQLGIAWLSFVTNSRARALAALRESWPGVQLVRSDQLTAELVEGIFAKCGNGRSQGRIPHLPLLVRGTDFQVKVWKALLRIPTGSVATYKDVAQAVGAPAATRAVGNAVGRNPVAFLIPCHRVVRSTGALGGYRWGTERKRLILSWEALHAGS
ncbi:MAG TPA: methylated-DNA--[protein]-cysteine S-methyltransferase [Gemmatimonadaceae bacterium]|nr:methylated-DNA--[protein]-cysteine S-methyltransferase [Gemmatimonadaceae bacterium]